MAIESASKVVSLNSRRISLAHLQGLLPVWISRNSGKFTANKILTVGAMADSYYEYLLKVWLLKRKQVGMPFPQY